MIRILINECNQILRHYQKIQFPGEIQEGTDSDMSLAEFEFKEMLELVDEKYRLVLVLYYVEGFSIAEIAKMLELNPNTVKTRLARAREQIRKAYFDDDSSDQKVNGDGLTKVSGSIRETKKENGFRRSLFLSFAQMYCFMPSVAVSSSALMVTVNFTPFSSLKRSSQ